MPTLSMFFGILIRMYKELNGQHNVPHFHAGYGEYEAVYDFDGNVLEGKLPKKQHNLVVACWKFTTKNSRQIGNCFAKMSRSLKLSL